MHGADGPKEPAPGGAPHGTWGSLWQVLVGRPLSTRQATKQQITPVEGLSALSLDALTSVAYGPEAILLVLAGAGIGALHDILPITGAIVVLLVILVVSYRQVIDAYPMGGGAYAVSRANLGVTVSQVAAASLIVDYTLTVAVSIAAGVGQLVSAFPALAPHPVLLCLGILLVITVLNIRGLGETARAFLLPTMLFIVGLLAVIVVGLLHPLALHVPQPGRVVVATQGLEAVGVLLVLKAFAAGCSALTGVEAIANGVPLFREPRAARAKRTELLLGVILGAMLLGLATLAVRFHIEPRTGQTVLSQIMGEAVGRHWAYYVVSLAITVVLALAANTSFGGLPVLASLLARDHALPHLFSLRGDRQTFSNGIWVLAVMSGALLVAVKGDTQRLIPLFAIGVFTGFTLSQTGLVVHWWRTRPTGWRRRAAINGIGALATGVSTIIFLVTKFTEGGWVVVVAVPLFMFLFRRISHYYARVAATLGFGVVPARPQAKPTFVIVPITTVSRLAAHALSEALSIGDEVLAVTVVIGDEHEEQAAACQREWAAWDPGVPLRVLRTQYASAVEPIVALIDEERATRQEQIVVLIPVVVPTRVRYRLLHNHIDAVLSAALRTRTDVVVARVPMALDPDTDDRAAVADHRSDHASASDQAGHDPGP
ncbi:MAG TPA: APC family permease [Acidimicrobiales bacterium]|nr:APC family permease [Acidimicrobiales bacterium]